MLRRALADSAFDAGGTTANGAAWGLWGRGSAIAALDGRSGGVSVDGDVLTAQAGADFSIDRWLLGLGVSHSRGEGGYAGAAGRGEMESSLTALTPYFGLDAGRLSAWGALSLGQGGMTLSPEGGAAVDFSMALELTRGPGPAGGNGRGVLLEARLDF